jgi:hypothetical protein
MNKNKEMGKTTKKNNDFGKENWMDFMAFEPARRAPLHARLVA